MLESYVQALIRLVQSGRISLEDIKNAEYRQEVEDTLAAQ